MPIPSSRSYIGVAKETTRGTPVTPVDSVPITSLTVHDEVTFVDDTGLRGSAVALYDRVASTQWSTVDISGHVFPDTIGYFLASVLPDYQSSGSAPTTHTFANLNTGTGQPKGYTIADYQGITTTSGARYFPGAGFSELTFKFDAAGALTYDAKATAYQSIAIATTAPTKTFGTLLPTSAYVGTVTIGGSVLTNVQMGDLSIKRPVTVIHSADGTPGPYNLFTGPVDVTGNLTFVAEDETEIVRYLGQTATIAAISTAYSAGQLVYPATPNGYVYQASVGGTSSGTPPTWPTTPGNTVTDGGVTWVCVGAWTSTQQKPSLDLTFASTAPANATTSLQLHCTSVIYQPADVIRTKDYVEVQVAFRARANTTDVGTSSGYSPIKVTLKNAKTTSYYA